MTATMKVWVRCWWLVSAFANLRPGAYDDNPRMRLLINLEMEVARSVKCGGQEEPVMMKGNQMDQWMVNQAFNVSKNNNPGKDLFESAYEGRQ